MQPRIFRGPYRPSSNEDCVGTRHEAAAAFSIRDAVGIEMSVEREMHWIQGLDCSPRGIIMPTSIRAGDGTPSPDQSKSVNGTTSGHYSVSIEMCEPPTLRHSFPQYPKLRSRHSHSIVLSHRNALTRQHKLFCTPQRTDSAIRQKSALLISKGNFGDSGSARIRRLSTTIGRFSKPRRNKPRPTGDQKRTVKHGRTVRTVAPGIRSSPWRASLAV